MKAVLLDALGTLVRLDDPAGRLAAALDLAPEDAARAMRAEIAHYRREHHRAGTRAGLEAVRDECAQVIEDELQTGRPRAEVRAALLEAIRFVPFDEVEGVLDRWAAVGIELAIVSNWDLSLHDVLDDLGWTSRFGAIVTSAELGIGKPDPRIFDAALDVLGVAARDAVHVGDDHDLDVVGARAAGVRPVLVVREGGAPDGVDAVRTLDQLP